MISLFGNTEVVCYFDLMLFDSRAQSENPCCLPEPRVPRIYSLYADTEITASFYQGGSPYENLLKTHRTWLAFYLHWSIALTPAIFTFVTIHAEEKNSWEYKLAHICSNCKHEREYIKANHPSITLSWLHFYWYTMWNGKQEPLRERGAGGVEERSASFPCLLICHLGCVNWLLKLEHQAF